MDIANKPDSSVIYVHFHNNGMWDESAVNSPMMYEGNPVGVVTEVSKDVVKGFIYDMKFCHERFADSGKIASVSFKIDKRGE